MADPRLTEIAVSLPFSINEFGSVASTTSQEKIWADRVRSAVGTGVNERLMRPNYGVDIRGAVMESSETAEELIKREVELAFTRDLTLLRLESVDTKFDPSESSVQVEITYLLPNRETEVILLGFATLSGSAPITEDAL
jgi:phage baseplate assembly protein W